MRKSGDTHTLRGKSGHTERQPQEGNHPPCTDSGGFRFGVFLSRHSPPRTGVSPDHLFFRLRPRCAVLVLHWLCESETRTCTVCFSHAAGSKVTCPCCDQVSAIAVLLFKFSLHFTQAARLVTQHCKETQGPRPAPGHWSPATQGGQGDRGARPGRTHPGLRPQGRCGPRGRSPPALGQKGKDLLTLLHEWVTLCCKKKNLNGQVERNVLPLGIRINPDCWLKLLR